MYGKLSVMIAGLFVCVVAISSCSVKENRSLCPCRLYFNIGEICPEKADSIVLNLSSADGFCHSVTVPVADDGVFRVDVPKTLLYMNAYYMDRTADETGLYGMFSHQEGFVIPESGQCPPVFLHSFQVDADTEELWLDVLPGKSYSRIDIQFADAENLDSRIHVKGNVCGYGLDGRPADGRFIFELKPDGEGVCSVRVPRQEDNSLVLTLSSGDGYEKNFALGEYISESGFDWTAFDLENILVEIDYSRTEITFKISNWEKTVHFDVVI